MSKHFYSILTFLFLIQFNILSAQSSNSARVTHDGNSACNNLTGDAKKACYDRVAAKNTAKFYANEKARKQKLEREAAIKNQKRDEEARKRKLEQERLVREQDRERKERESNRKFIQIELPPTSKSNAAQSSEKSLEEIKKNNPDMEKAKLEAAINHAKWIEQQKSNARNAYNSGNYYEASKTYEMLGDNEGVLKSDIGMAGKVINDMFPGRTQSEIKRLGELKKSVYSEEVTGSLVDGLAPKRNKKGWYGYIDNLGEWIIKPKYIRASEFKNGSATVVTKAGRKIKINIKGKKQ